MFVAGAIEVENDAPAPIRLAALAQQPAHEPQGADGSQQFRHDEARQVPGGRRKRCWLEARNRHGGLANDVGAVNQ